MGCVTLMSFCLNMMAAESSMHSAECLCGARRAPNVLHQQLLRIFTDYELPAVQKETSQCSWVDLLNFIVHLTERVLIDQQKNTFNEPVLA